MVHLIILNHFRVDRQFNFSISIKAFQKWNRLPLPVLRRLDIRLIDELDQVDFDDSDRFLSVSFLDHDYQASKTVFKYISDSISSDCSQHCQSFIFKVCARLSRTNTDSSLSLEPAVTFLQNNCNLYIIRHMQVNLMQDYVKFVMNGLELSIFRKLRHVS